MLIQSDFIVNALCEALFCIIDALWTKCIYLQRIFVNFSMDKTYMLDSAAQSTNAE